MQNSCRIDCNECRAHPFSIFKHMLPGSMNTIEQSKVCQQYKKGEIIFHEGSLPRGLYCVLSGKIKVVQTGLDGKEQILHLVHDGHVMGHRALLANDTYSCTAIAIEDASVCFIPKRSFFELAAQHPEFALHIAQILAEELRKAELKITSTAQRPVKERLALALLDLSEKYGFMADHKTIDIDVKRLDLANLAGTTRETATRFLHELQEQAIVSLSGKRICIENFQALQLLTHMPVKNC